MNRLLTFTTGMLLAGMLNAQISFNTGSAELDADLNIINNDAKSNLSAFKTNLSVEFNVSDGQINKMFSLDMQPGEVYLALEIAKIANKPVDGVIKTYKVHKDKGWGYIAKEMGIKPGSKMFHALKGNAANKKAKGRPDHAGKGKHKPKAPPKGKIKRGKIKK